MWVADHAPRWCCGSHAQMGTEGLAVASSRGPGIGLAVGEGLAGNAKAAACPARLGPKEQAE